TPTANCVAVDDFFEIGACWHGTVRVCSRRAYACYRPSVKTLQPRRPLDLSCFQIKRKRGVEEIVNCDAVRCRSSVLASLHICGRSVVVAGSNEERAALWIDCWWLPNRAATVSPRLSAIVRHVEGFPKHRTGFLIE